MIRRIRTRRTLAQRALKALDDHPFLPLAVVLVALYFINS